MSGPLRRAASSSTTRPHPPQCARDTARRIACRASAKSDAVPAALGATLASRGEESLRRQRRSPVMPTCWGVRGLSASSAQEEEVCCAGTTHVPCGWRCCVGVCGRVLAVVFVLIDLGRTCANCKSFSPAEPVVLTAVRSNGREPQVGLRGHIGITSAVHRTLIHHCGPSHLRPPIRMAARSECQLMDSLWPCICRCTSRTASIPTNGAARTLAENTPLPFNCITAAAFLPGKAAHTERLDELLRRLLEWGGVPLGKQSALQPVHRVCRI